MSASSPVPLDGMANADADGRYTNGGLAGDGSGDVRMPDDAEGTVALGDDAHHAGTLDAQSSGDPTQSAGGDGRGPGSPHKSNSYREPQPKPNKVYIGNLPEHTRESDLQSCFGKIGRIASIELKVGYGFVEFETTEAAEESVAKYHEGWFMGNKIKVEISRGRNRPKTNPNEPGACFKCGQVGHWARECPNSTNGHTGPGNGGPIRSQSYRPADSLLGRISDGPSRDYPPPPPPLRDYPPRDDYGSNRHPNGGRYSYDYSGPPRDLPPRDTRDYYNSNAPPRVPPPPSRPPRDFDDYGRRDYRGGPPGPPGPPPPNDGRPYYPEYDRDPAYARAPYNGPPPSARDGYDRPPYDRRAPPADRFGPPPVHRPRTPPGPPPPRGRDGYPAARDYPPPPAAVDYRRPPSPGAGPAPPRYDYAQSRPDNRGPYRPPRGRSQSPPRAGYRNYDSAGSAGGFGPPSDRAPYGGGAYAGNGYSSGPPLGGMPPIGHARPAGGRGRPGIDDRDGHYVPRPADRGNDAPGYARRA